MHTPPNSDATAVSPSTSQAMLRGNKQICLWRNTDATVSNDGVMIPASGILI